MDKLDKAIERMIKLKETCDWNNMGYKEVPAYKSQKEEIIKAVLSIKKLGCGELFKPEHFGMTCGEISPLTNKVMLCKKCEESTKNEEVSIRNLSDDEVKHLPKEILKGLSNALEDVKKGRYTVASSTKGVK